MQSQSIYTLAGILIFFALGGCAIASTNVKHVAVSYENSARTAYEKFFDMEMKAAIIEPKRLLPAQDKDILFGEELVRTIHDCSTTGYRCISVWSRVFAVPRARLSSEMTYELGGAVFKVEDCLRGDSTVCQVAIISADCRKVWTAVR